MTAPTDLPAFIAKWRDNARRERASSQEHFLDLCRLTGAPTPNEADPTGHEYAFEAGADKTSGGVCAPGRKRGRCILTQETALDRLKKVRLNGHSLDRLGPYAQIEGL